MKKILDYCLSGSALDIFIQNMHDPHLWVWSDFYKSIEIIATPLKWNRHFSSFVQKDFSYQCVGLFLPSVTHGNYALILFLSYLFISLRAVCVWVVRRHIMALWGDRLLKGPGTRPWLVIACCIPVPSCAL